jgi:uncharacterized protein
MHSKQVFIVAIALVVTGLLAAFIVSRPWIAFRNVKPLSVTGYAEIPVRSDIGDLSATVTVTGPTTQYVYETAGTQLERIRTLLEDQNLDHFKITEAASSLSEVLQVAPDGRRLNAIDYYVAYRTLRIETTEVDALETLTRRIYDLNAEGMRVSVAGPQYMIRDLGETKIKLVREATRNGMERAKTIAKNSRAGLGKLVSARQGVIQITPPNSTETADWGMYDTSTIDKVAKITVHLELGIR